MDVSAIKLVPTVLTVIRSIYSTGKYQRKTKKPP